MIVTKTCPGCGSAADSTARFCLECGHPFANHDAASEPEDPWRGRIVAGRFLLLGKLGEGGMGEVFVAEQRPMGRRVALKILRAQLCDDARQVERFKREAQAASRLSHPNTIIVHDFGQDDDGTLFIAMELLEGETLSDVLEREDRLEPTRAARIMAAVCGSLEEAHGQGVIHRDLKPENIFLTRRGGARDFVKVLDFGIAKVHESPDGGKLDTITRDGAIFGTPQYMSPEQIRGAPLDARSDVYSLGVILYQMIAGALPFTAGTAVEMLTKHLSEQPAPIRRPTGGHPDDEAVARLEAVAFRALSKDPGMRPRSAQVFLDEITAAMSGFMTSSGLAPVPPTPTGPVPVPVPTASPPAPRPRSALLAVVLAGALLAAGAVAWLVLSEPDPSPPVGPLVGGPGGSDPGRGGTPPTEDEALRAAEAAEVERARAEADERRAGDEVAAKSRAEAQAKQEADRAAAEAERLATAEREARLLAEKTRAEADRKAAEEAASRAQAEREAAEKALADARAQLAALEAEKEGAEAAAAAAQARKEEAAARARAAREKKPPQAVGFGRLHIKSEPPGARILVDGQFRGKSPLSGIMVSPGERRIEAEMAGKRIGQTVMVKPNAVRQVDLRF